MLRPFAIVFFSIIILGNIYSQDSSHGIKKVTEIKNLAYITDFMDLNNNGKLDIVGIGPKEQNGQLFNKIFERENDTTYEEVFVGKWVFDEYPEWIGDIDEDGLAEIMTSEYFAANHRRLILYESKASISYPDTTNEIWSFIRGWYNFNPIYNEDLNKNGKDEIIFADHDSSRFTILMFECNTNNNLEMITKIELDDADAGPLSFGDLDGDGYKEIIVGNLYGWIRIYRYANNNQYDLMCEIKMGNSISNTYATAYLGDSNGNGRNEFAVAGDLPGEYHLLHVYEYLDEYNFEVIWENRYYEFPYFTKTIIPCNIEGSNTTQFAFNLEQRTWVYRASKENVFEEVLNFEGGVALKIYNLDYDRKDEILYKKDFDNIIVVKYDTMLTNVHNKLFSSDFEIFRNHPNPFNNSTFIYYKIEKLSEIEISIYNILGVKVKSLYKGEQSTGDYKITWDGKDDKGEKVSSGIYIIKLQNQQYIKSIKALLLK